MKTVDGSSRKVEIYLFSRIQLTLQSTHDQPFYLYTLPKRRVALPKPQFKFGLSHQVQRNWEYMGTYGLHVGAVAELQSLF